MGRDTTEARTPAGRWLGLLVVVAVMVGGSSAFLPSQTLWLDETTQMTGLAMGPVEVVHWLSGSDSRDFGQFRDRMPPASYWMGWLWSKVGGLGETSLRWSGVACLAIASALVFEAARRAFGLASGWAAGLVFATSPVVVAISVEIRAYPLFLLGSAASLYCLVRVETSEEPARRVRWMSGLAVALMASVATHFYGVVLAGASLVALVMMAWRKGWRPTPIVGVGIAVGVSTVAILPFVGQAMGQQKGGARWGVLRSLEAVYKMVLNQFDHPAMMVDAAVEPCLLAAIVILAVVATRSRSLAAGSVGIGLIAGLGAVFVAELVLARGNFLPSAPHYNLWMMPGLCLLLSAGLGDRSRGMVRVAAFGLVLLVTAQGVGVVRLASHGVAFAHGPHRAMAGLIRSVGPNEVAIVVEDRDALFPFLTCPIRYEFGPDLDQFLVLDGSKVVATDGYRPSNGPRLDVATLPHRYLVVVRPLALGAVDLAKQIRLGDRPIEPGPIARSLAASGNRTLIRSEQHTARIAARVDVFERNRLRSSTLAPVDRVKGVEE